MLPLLRTIIAALILMFPGLPAVAGMIQIAGTGSALEPLRILGQAFSRLHPDMEIEVLPSLGSKGGLRALMAGRVDLAVIVQSPDTLPPEHGWSVLTWARTPTTIGVGERNPATALSSRDLVEIYSGRQTKWPGGTSIRPILRPPLDSAHILLHDMAPGMGDALDSAQRIWGHSMAVTDQDAADIIQSVPGTFGILTLGQIMAEHRKIRPLVLDGVEPTLAALAAGRYPHAITYQLVTRDPAGPGLAAFLAYLGSAEAREQAAALGVLVIGPP
jgi:phosphate transport system substrate-binding protein